MSSRVASSSSASSVVVAVVVRSSVSSGRSRGRRRVVVGSARAPRAVRRRRGGGGGGVTVGRAAATGGADLNDGTDGGAAARSAAVVDLFERAATPMGAAERADAAMAAVRAMGRAGESGGSWSASDVGRASAASASGVGAGSGSIGGNGSEGLKSAGKQALGSSSSGSSSARKPKAETFTPGSDFWKWSPPEAPSGGAAPQLKRQTKKRVSAAVAFAERAPEGSLQLTFQSDLEAPKELTIEFETQAAGPEMTPETPTVELEETATAVRELGSDGTTEGILENGSRWWRESGEEELEGGKLCRWTLVRGASADGSVEWEEKWWETSDAFNYRELGAVKSGRDAQGNVWQESWREQMTHDAKSGFSNASKHISREANKWGKQADGAEWHEVWDENYWGDGRVKRTCTKKGAIADGTNPDDGHGNRWTHKWGEEWDGHGGCVKWTDSFADRDQSEDGGSGRAWGERWEERWGAFAHNGSAGNRSGSTWNDRDGYKFEKTWGEEHWHDGRVHKWGSTTDGSDGWDTWQDSEGWWERSPSFGWDEAVSHSPQLLSVPLRSRAADGTGTTAGKKSIGRAPGRAIKPPPGSKLHNPNQ